VVYPRTHNLATLVELLRENATELPPDGEALAQLIPLGVAMRYEDAVAEDELVVDRGWALAIVTRILEWAQRLVG
jgi:HEPN domain-containing protein